MVKMVGIYLDKIFLPILSLHGTEEKTAHQSAEKTQAVSESRGRVFGVIGEWVRYGWNCR